MMQILRDAWADLTGWQKIAVTATILALAGIAISGWIDSAVSLREVKRLEREATAAKRDAAEQLERAAKLAGQIREREAELNRLEGERDEKFKTMDKSRLAADNARADFDRARERERTDNPDADTLCRELAALGYPCK